MHTVTPLTLPASPARLRFAWACGLTAVMFLSGCIPGNRGPRGGAAPRLQTINLNDVARADAAGQAVDLGGARNEWTSFTLQLSDLPADGAYSLRLRAPQLQSADASIEAGNFEVYQVLPMPVDVNRAGYVRHTGLSSAPRNLPRALLPLPTSNGLLDLRSLRDPSRPKGGTGIGKGAKGNSAPARAAMRGPLRLWVDVRIPSDARAGDYVGVCDLLPENGTRPVASVPVKLRVYDFDMPQERHLQVVGRMPWESLVRLYPDRFETVTPRLLKRGDPRYAAAVRTLDQLVSLAQRHRAAAVVPRLQPTVKWPANEQPLIDWSDFDSVVAPWLRGDAFADGQPLTLWPLPAPDFLEQFDRKSQLDYWSLAAAHFDQNDWLSRSAVWVEKITPGRARAADSVELSARAADLLALHTRLCVTLPLEDDQLQLVEPDAPNMIDPATTSRIWAAAPGLVFAPPTQPWPEQVTPPDHWLRTDMPGLVPYVGAGGDEGDVRLWAWLAFLRNPSKSDPKDEGRSMIVWNGALPTLSDPSQPADPNELIWFYPGEWFGVQEPVPTVQLKWLRRAQQDYEYLWLAKSRGEWLNALMMARLITKAVEIQPGQVPDPSYALMCGTSDPQAWSDAQRLLAATILLRQPGQAPDPARQHALYNETRLWQEPQERPILMGRTTQWLWDDFAQGGAGGPGDRLSLRLGIDIYNASETTPDDNSLRWTAIPKGWEVAPQPIKVPAMSTYRVNRVRLEGKFNPNGITPAAREPVDLTFTNGFTNVDRTLRLVLPVAASERLEGRPLLIDGKLDEWHELDLLQDGPLVRMLSRPSLQRQELQYASTPARIYSGWAADHFYLAFRLEGISTDFRGSQNFVDYQFRRAWGEDLCSVLIQPVYADNTAGPVLHIICKPLGQDWIERKVDPRMNANPWKPIEGAGVRYKAQLDPARGAWVGEVAIPWSAIGDETRGTPRLLRFNFVQHRTAAGESASWAGPVDFGRDDNFTGVLYLREAAPPGMRGPVGDAGAGD